MSRITAALLAVLLLASLAACGTEPQMAGASVFPEQTESTGIEEEQESFSGLAYESSMELMYATQFSVDYYEGGYKLLTVGGETQYLLIPEGEKAPEGLDPSVCRLYMPLDSIYLAATSAMALFDALDALDAIALSGTKAEGWTIENAFAAMERGEILYAGKYSEPDYEMLMEHGCDLAIESTMILHTPKVQEMIELLGIPVLIERSSYESHPLARTEWIKLYGALLDEEAAAEAFFREQAAVIDELADFENTGKTVAFFYISTDGSVVVRSSADYVPRMIELAGGQYVFDDLVSEEGRRSSVSVTMEDFYAAAVDADYLIYNTDIDGTVASLDDLLQKDALFRDFKAVQNGDVWYTGKYLYQATDIVGSLITDIHRMLCDETEGMVFLTKLE